MADLAAGGVSLVAWPILKCAIENVVALPDAAAVEAMRLLAAGSGGDPALEVNPREAERVRLILQRSST